MQEKEGIRRQTLTSQGQRNRKKKTGRRKRQRRKMMIAICAAVISMSIMIVLFVADHYFKTHFIQGTYINEIDVSNMNVDQLEGKMRQYQLSIRERKADGSYISETITGDQIGVSVSEMSQLDDILRSQNVFRALIQILGKKEKQYHISGLYKYENAALDYAIGKLQGFQEDFVQVPTDACISEYDPTLGYRIIPQTEGNQLKAEQAKKVIKDAVDALEFSVDLEEKDCYEKPGIYEDDARLVALLPQLKKYTDVVITYQFGDVTERIDGTVIDEWLEIDEEKSNVILSREQVDNFVVSLRKKYDTIFRDRTFQTSYGKEITISGGDYGWWMNYVKEQDALYEMIENGESGERVPEYYQTAAAYGTKDYGDTYVEINLTAQHLFLYVDGKKTLESDFVSGNESRNFHTPEGIYGITYKEQDAMLVGEDYETPVSFWMPFNGNVGLHDAIWREEFGADVYKKSGSHGCVNLPYGVAKEIYSQVSKHTPVICYHMDGTQRAETTKQSQKQMAQSVIDSIEKIGEVTKDSEKKIIRARQLYDEVSETAREYVTNYSKLTEAEERFKEIMAK